MPHEKTRKYLTLGAFELSGGTLRLSDPAYEKDSPCAVDVDNCKPGTWHAAVGYVEDMGHRVAFLVAAHSSVPDSTLADALRRGKKNGYWTAPWAPCDYVPVDSGQAGIFDKAHYGENSLFTTPSECGYGDRWYGHCCDLTLSNAQGGVIPFGAVSSSAWGDGCYLAFKRLSAEDAKVDMVAIHF